MEVDSVSDLQGEWPWQGSQLESLLDLGVQLIMILPPV